MENITKQKISYRRSDEGTIYQRHCTYEELCRLLSLFEDDRFITDFLNMETMMVDFRIEERNHPNLVPDYSMKFFFRVFNPSLDLEIAIIGLGL